MKLEDIMKSYTITITDTERGWIECALRCLVDSKNYENEIKKENIIKQLYEEFVKLQDETG